MSVELKFTTANLNILCNHSSGNLKPSISYIGLKTKFKEAEKLIDINFLEYLILSANY